MIMKNGKRIRFIYKNGKRIDKIIRHGKVYFEQGFVKEQTSTTLPISFNNISRDYLKDYKMYGNTKQQLLPDAYTQVDYLKSENYTNYFIIPHEESFDNLGCDFKINIESRQGQYGPHIISSIDNKSNFWVVTRPSDLFIRYYMSANTFPNIYNNTDGIGVDTRIECNIDGTNKVIVNETNIGTLTKGSEVPNTNDIYLLNYPGSLGGNYGFKGKFYYCKLYSNGKLIYDFIPCYRNSDNEVGLYDLVNNAFYTNQGTGEFTYGSIAPTPNAPIEIISCGDRTKNLFNLKYELETQYATDGNVITNYYFLHNDVVSISKSNAQWGRYFFNKITLDAGTYTLSFILSLSGSDKRINRSVRNLDTQQDIVTNERLSINDGETQSLTFTLSSKQSISFSLQPATNESGTLNLTNIQLEKSSAPTPYEPYGYKIPVNVKSENLCDGINKKYWLSTTVLSAGMADGNSGLAIELKENTNYTISTQIIQERYRVALINTLPTSGIGIPCYNGVKKDGTEDNITISSNQYKYLILNATDLTKCQIVEGSTAPSKYIPYYNETTNIYLDEPLRKNNRYSDYID